MDIKTDLLLEIPENPVPPGAVSGMFEAADGRHIRYARFPAQNRPHNGTVILLQGRNECIEKYFETIGDLAGRGFGVATFDWRGQGGSDRMLQDPSKGYVDNFHSYVGDLEQFFEDIVLPDCRGPYYILAHSTGSLVALLASPNLVNRVRRMVLVSPLLALEKKGLPMGSIAFIARALSFLGLGSLYMTGGSRSREPTPFAANVLTTDHRRYTRNIAIYEARPGLALGGPTIAWIDAACRAIATVSDPDFIASIRIPALLVQAGADVVVSNPAIEDYARRMRCGSMLTIDGARHEILQEADIYREQLLAAFDAFIPGEGADIA